MILTRIGQKIEGGHFTGFNRIQHCVYSIIVEPKSLQDQLAIKTVCSATLNTQSVNNGWANTASMNDNSHPAAQYCRTLTAGGYTDWYLPSRDELELCYRYLKPTTTNNTTSDPSIGGNQNTQPGTNLNSVPVGAPYTTTKPLQTIVTAFCTGSVAAFDAGWCWTSTESSTNPSSSLFQYFSDGTQYWLSKTNVYRVRGIRRIPINFE